MQPTSLVFLIFFVFCLFSYYLMPYPIRRYWLALINLFYVSSFGSLSLIYLFVISLVTYIFGIKLSKSNQKKQASSLLIAIVVLVTGLVIFKYYKLIFPFFHFCLLYTSFITGSLNCLPFVSTVAAVYPL